MLNHPALLGALAEDFAALDLKAPDLDKLRQAILNLAALTPDLDAAALRIHLCRDEFARAVDGLLSSQVYVHAGFSRPGSDLEAARRGWVETRQIYQQLRQLAAEMDAAERIHAEEMTESTDARLARLTALRQELNGAEEEPEASAGPDLDA